ncbi:MAG: hypothetical protein M1825_001999 [Sarcosagium campestre]|nr:MAG: hypothetical protein M1825_001999 [Sarcosagium campestre]
MDDGAAQPLTLAARKAALNLDQVGSSLEIPGRSRPRGAAPTPPARPKANLRRQTANNPPLQSNGVSTVHKIGNEPIGSKQNGILPPPSIGTTGSEKRQTPRPSLPPRIPPRKNVNAQQSPSLPPRRSQEASNRRDSFESTSSAVSNVSSISALSIGNGMVSSSRPPSSDDISGRIKAPPFDPASLPRLPQRKKTEEESLPRVSLRQSHTSPVLATVKRSPLPTPSLPPRQPARIPEVANSSKTLHQNLPPAMPKRSALSFGMNKETVEEAPPLPSTRPTAASQHPDGTNGATPPPVPYSSRPATTLQRQSSHPTSSAAPTESCLLCHDFSLPDAHAAKFPRSSLPASTTTAWLSAQLTSPFRSQTDKARAIFTWLHHNISYDVDAFFSHNVQPSTPASTLSSGLAVCEGYAGLFTALAAPAGLESIVTSGHGKGYGFSSLSPHDPVPTYSANHAWNAVKLDDGRWKLIDPCWGAGAVNGPGQPYTRRFDPSFFTMSNNTFGLRHFPGDRAHFFRDDDDSHIPTWAEYIMGDPAGEPPTIFTGAAHKHGLSELSIRPAHKNINVSSSSSSSSSTVRFAFSKTCPHWNNETMGEGKPYAFIVSVHSEDGQRDDHIPFEYDGDGEWWCDVPRKLLGKPGQSILVYPVDSIAGKDVRGLTAEEFRRARGKKSMSFGYSLARWELV